MGIRIEDSVCVGEEAPLVLSTEAAKEVSALVDLWSCSDSWGSSLTEQVVDIEALGESHAQ